jgi:transmembrane sensor
MKPAIAQAAAYWLVEQEAGTLNAKQIAEFERWLAAHPDHAQAWQQLKLLQGRFAAAQTPVSSATLTSAQHSRRRFMKNISLGIAAIATPTIAYRAIPWEVWTANMQTAYGETRTLQLTNGTNIALSSHTAIDMSADQQQITLYRGEIWIDTATSAASAKQALRIITAQASIRPLGTRFSVSQSKTHSRLAVFADRVAVQHRSGAQAVISAGQQVLLNEQGIQAATPVDEAQAAAWRQGLYIAHEERLDTLLATLAQWRSGIIQVEPAIAALPISGAFPLHNTDAALALIARTLPVKIQRWSPYWIRVQARAS